MSSNGLQYVFILKPDLKFSDGSALTATDVAATLNHERTDSTNDFEALLGAIKSVTAPSPTKVVIALSQPATALPSTLSQSQFSDLPRGRRHE